MHTIPEKEERYRVCEIAKAADVTAPTVYSRLKRLGIKPDRRGITYEQLVKVLTYKPKTEKASPAKVDKLKLKLKNDGFKIKEGEAMK